MMNFLLSSIAELTDKKSQHMFNLFDSSNRNAHLVAIGSSGTGKTHFFRQLIEQEHVQYTSMTSFILNQHGMDEYKEVWESAKTKKVHEVSKYTINPFDCCYLEEEHTVEKVNKLLHSIGLSLFIEWTDLHNKFTREYIELLMLKFSEEQLIPTIHDLYTIVKANTINYTKQQDMITLLDICSVLELFENDSLPLKRMFNGMTDIPCYDEKQVVYIEGGGVLQEYLAPYTSLLIEHLYLLQRYSLQQETFIAAPYNHKFAFYQDGFHSFYDDPCYSYLTNFVMRSDLPMHLGVRLSVQLIDPLLSTHPVLQASSHYFIQRLLGISQEDLSYLSLSETVRQMTLHSLKVGEGIYLNEDSGKEIYLDGAV